jgi:hypothetical protein
VRWPLAGFYERPQVERRLLGIVSGGRKKGPPRSKLRVHLRRLGTGAESIGRGRVLVLSVHIARGRGMPNANRRKLRGLLAQVGPLAWPAPASRLSSGRAPSEPAQQRAGLGRGKRAITVAPRASFLALRVFEAKCPTLLKGNQSLHRRTWIRIVRKRSGVVAA